MLPQYSHITKKRGVYYYRRRIPQTASREVVLSLRTRAFRVAESLADALDREFLRLLQDVTTDDTDLQAILRAYLKRRLEFDMWRRAESPNAPMFGSPEPGRSHANIDLEWIDHELAIARSELAGRLYNQQRPLIEEVMESHKSWPQGSGKATELHVYPASRGNILRHLGEDIEHAAELVAETYIKQIEVATVSRPSRFVRAAPRMLKVRSRVRRLP